MGTYRFMYSTAAFIPNSNFFTLRADEMHALPALSYARWCCLAAEIGNYHYGPGHPMKPHRVRMTHNLVVNYGLYRQMEVFRPKPISSQQMTRFHSDDYINFLRVITQDNMQVSCTIDFLMPPAGRASCDCPWSFLPVLFHTG